MFTWARLALVATCAVAIGACGSGVSMVVSSQGATTTQAATETLTVPTTFHNPPVPNPAQPVRGPGRVLGPVLLFHIDGGVADYYNSSYWAAFRTAGRFTKQMKNGDGKRFPGKVWIGDSENDIEGFNSAGPGTDHGRCFIWGVTATPLLEAKKTGDPVPITFKLRRTTGIQRRIAHIQIVSNSQTSSVRRAFTRIGCKPGSFGDSD